MCKGKNKLTQAKYKNANKPNANEKVTKRKVQQQQQIMPASQTTKQKTQKGKQ